MINYRIDKRVHYIGGSVQSTARLWPAAAPAGNWWEAGSATGCIAAYQPKGAASYAASLTDLSGNSNAAAEGTAPSWASGTGWTFDGSTQFLTAAALTTATTHTLIVRFNNATENTGGNLIGDAQQGLRPYVNSSVGVRYMGATSQNVAPAIGGDAVLAIVSNAGYRNGTIDTTSYAQGTLDRAISICGNDTWGGWQVADIYAAAVYSGDLTAPQIAAVSAAMAAL